MDRRADTPWTSSAFVRALPLVIGVVVVATGVALNESGVGAGRTVILVGLPLALGGLLAIAIPRKDAAQAMPSGPSLEEALGPVAAHWNLTMSADDVGLRVHGIVKGRKVELSTDGGQWPLLVRAATNRPLDMGLTVQRGGKPPGDARREHLTGDDPFDAEYCVRVDEVQRAGNLLTDRMREQLLRANASLDDDGVSIVCGPSDASTLMDTVRLAVRVAAELERAAVKVPCADSLNVVRDEWLEFAGEAKLATADTPLSMWGTIDGIEVRIQSVRDSFRNFHFEVVTAFPEPLGRGLSLKPASSATQFDRTGEPIGHPAFDRNFSLSTKNPLDAARLLGPETRLAVLRLREQGLQVRGTDDRLWAWVGFNPKEPKAVPDGVEKMVQIAARVVANAARFPAGSQRSFSERPPPKKS